MEYSDEYIDFRKGLVVEYMKLGMDMYGACVAAECDPDLIDILEHDEEFNRICEYHVKNRELELLRKLNSTAEKILGKGDTKAVERMLEILNPDRYSKTTKLAHSVGGNGKRAPTGVTISFVGTEPPSSAGEFGEQSSAE